MQDTRKLLVDRILGVALSIRETKPDKQHVMRNYWIWPHEHPEAAAEVEAIASEIVRCNPLALHEGDVKQSIVPIILKEVVADCIDENRLRTEASSAVDWLAGFDGKQELHVQLANLIVNEPYVFAGVELRGIPNTGDTTERQLKYDGPLASSGPIESINSFAIARSVPGLGHKALTNAVEGVEEVISLLRGIGLPYLWGRTWHEAGIAGRGFASGWAILRRGSGGWTIALGGGGPDKFMRLNAMLRNWTASEIEILEQIHSKGSPRSGVEEKVHQAMLWLGEATLPANNASRFAKLSLAFESAVGGEARSITEIGVTEMLAERTAFLIGNSDGARRDIHDIVKRLYRVRSNLVHGDPNPVSDANLAKWAMLVWLTVRSMLSRAHEFATVENFATWVRSQRYTLPTAR